MVGQPSTNPRVIKEAEALGEAGYSVEAIGGFWVKWADEIDKKLPKSRTWEYIRVGGSPEDQKLLYLWTRIRGKFIHSLAKAFKFTPVFWPECLVSRVTPELTKAARAIKADLYIAHNLGALPAAAKAAKKHKAKLGFDIEDFHTENFSGEKNNIVAKSSEFIEKRYLPRCDYTTASSESIAQAYVRKYSIKEPQVVLNTFPLSMLQEGTKKENSELSLYWFSHKIGRGRGLEDIIQAMGIVKREIKLYLQGCISNEYKADLARLALKSNLKNDQTSFLEPADPEELFKIASQFDAGLALERKQPLSRDLCVTNKIFTYLLAGLSIIATGTQGQRPIIESIGKAGWMYRPGDIKALAKRLDFLAENKTALLESKKEALKQGQERYNWDLEKKRLLELIEQII